MLHFSVQLFTHVLNQYNRYSCELFNVRCVAVPWHALARCMTRWHMPIAVLQLLPAKEIYGCGAPRTNQSPVTSPATEHTVIGVCFVGHWTGSLESSCHGERTAPMRSFADLQRESIGDEILHSCLYFPAFTFRHLSSIHLGQFVNLSVAVQSSPCLQPYCTTRSNDATCQQLSTTVVSHVAAWCVSKQKSSLRATSSVPMAVTVLAGDGSDNLVSVAVVPEWSSTFAVISTKEAMSVVLCYELF